MRSKNSKKYDKDQKSKSTDKVNRLWQSSKTVIKGNSKAFVIKQSKMNINFGTGFSAGGLVEVAKLLHLPLDTFISPWQHHNKW